MNTLNDFIDVKKALNDLILKHHSTIVMIKEHTGIPGERIHQLILGNAKATNKEAYEIMSLLTDILNFDNNKKAILDYLTSEKIINKKKETVTAVLDMLDFGDVDYAPSGRELFNYADKHGV